MIYPLDRFPVPTNFGHLHKAKFEFHLILTNLARRVFGRADHIAKLSVSEAKGYQALLESWYNGLHESLTPANIVFPAQLKLQYAFLVLSSPTVLQHVCHVPLTPLAVWSTLKQSGFCGKHSWT